MNDYDENLMEMASYWAPPSSPSPRTILEMLNQTDNNQNPISEMFPDHGTHDHQAEERPGLGQRLAMRTGFSLPALDTENISGFASIFKNTTVPSHVPPISPGFSPSVLLQSPKTFSDPSQSITQSPVTNSEPPEIVGSCGDEKTAAMISNDHLPQPMHDDLPPQEGFGDIQTEESVYIPTQDESHVEPTAASLLTHDDIFDEGHMINLMISMEEENKDDEDGEDEDENEDEDEDDQDKEIIDVDESDDAESSVPKRRRYEVLTNMIGATRTSKSMHRIIIQMECEEENPEDGFRWRKYGRKVVKGNPNPRSYYKCTSRDCNVKKHVERGADDVKLVVITYDGRHNHPLPPKRSEGGSRIRSGGPTMSQTSRQLGQSFRSVKLRPFTALGPQMNMTQLYTTGLEKLPSLQVNQRTGLMYQNDEPIMIPNGTGGVYNGFMGQLNGQLGSNFYM